VLRAWCFGLVIEQQQINACKLAPVPPGKREVLKQSRHANTKHGVVEAGRLACKGRWSVSIN